MPVLEGLRKRRMMKRSYTLLLVALLAMELLVPLFAELGFRRRLIPELFFVGVLLAALGIAVDRARPLVVLLLLASVSELLEWTNLSAWLGTDTSIAIQAVARMAFLVTIIVIVLRHVLSADRVTVDKILGAACVYFMLGMGFSFLYALLLHFNPESILFPEHLALSGAVTEAVRMDALNYFSFSTLTTLGYGDVIPAEPVARSVSSVEAVLGQLYVAIVIARLVGLEIAYHLSDQAGRTSPAAPMDESTASSTS